MSRTSSKSPLSPSVTGGSGINLGKSGGVDLGRKTEPSITSGGVGISTEVANIGGLSVTGGVSVDISPIDLGINYDPAENSVSIAAGAEVPGGLLGVSGGVTVDLDTGEIIGGAAGVEVAGLGVNVSNSKKGGLGVSITVQIPFTPIELELGFGFPSEEEEEKTPTSKPKPPPSGNNPQGFETSKQCFGGSFELVRSFTLPGGDGKARIFKMEESLRLGDADAEVVGWHMAKNIMMPLPTENLEKTNGVKN
jgi:hypothetical protein